MTPNNTTNPDSQIGQQKDLKTAIHTIGLITALSTDVVTSPYLRDIIAGITEELISMDCNLQWIMIRDRDLENHDLKFLRQQYPSVEGFLLPCWRHFPKLAEQLTLQRYNFPSVLINDYDSEIPLSSVRCDNKSGVKKVWRHLMERGYKEIGFAKGPEYISPDAKERYEAFLECAKKDGVTLNDSHVYESSRFDEEAGYHIMQLWVLKGGLPRAIFCANDDLARGCIRALKEKGKRIPEDIAIAGFDDSQMDALLDPPLTTVHQPLKKIGAAAVQILLRLLQKKDNPPIKLKFEPELIIRKST